MASGRTGGITWADLDVTPSDAGISLRIEATDPADPVRDIHVWMPDWQGRRFAGERWQPGAAFSPFHPLFLERLAPFDVIRFMGMQETNASDIVTWSDRRAATDARQSSGQGGSPSEPLVNGLSVEYMVQLANGLDADPWFNMPHMADDGFVANFATYVRDHLEPSRKVYVEWANEVWNFGWGFEASQWVAGQLALPENAGLDQWQVAGREAKRDLDIWSAVFAGQESRLVRVAAGWAAVDWVTNRIAASMAGAFDAIAIAPSITPTDAQRESYSAATTVDFQFTGADGAAAWGDFAKLHRMNQPLTEAHLYRAVVAAANGSFWDSPPPPVTPPLGPPQFSISGGSLVEGHAGRRWLTFTITLSHAATRPTSVGWATGNGSAVAGRDYVKASGRIAFAVGQTVRTIRVAVIGDRLREADERFHVGLGAPVNARLATTARLAWATILDDDRPAAAASSLFAALAAAAGETATKPASR